jgi:hypothetical protein
VAQAADIIIVMVPDTPDVGQVLFGEGGVAEGLSQGKLVIDMSSISPVATKDFAAKIKRWAATTWTRRSPAAKWAPRTPRCPSWSAASPPPSSAPSRCSS